MRELKKIEFHDLPLESVEFPQEYYEAKLAENKASANLADAKDDLTLIEAQISLEVYKDPRKYGFRPDRQITSTMLNSVVLQSEEYNAAQSAYRRAQKAFDDAKAYSDAVFAKKAMLTNLWGEYVIERGIDVKPSFKARR